MGLQKLWKDHIYFFKPKWLEINTQKTYSMKECPQIDLLRLWHWKRGTKKYENSLLSIKMREKIF